MQERTAKAKTVGCGTVAVAWTRDDRDEDAECDGIGDPEHLGTGPIAKRQRTEARGGGSVGIGHVHRAKAVIYCRCLYGYPFEQRNIAPCDTSSYLL